MRDKTHLEELERWAKYVKENPNTWKAKIKPFLDAQIIIARKFYKNLAEKQGKDKVNLILSQDN